MGDLTLGVEGLREGIKGRDSALPIILGCGVGEVLNMRIGRKFDILILIFCRLH